MRTGLYMGRPVPSISAGIAIVALLAASGAAHEPKHRSGARIGLQWARLSFGALPSAVESVSRPGLTAEAYLNIRMHRNLSIETAFAVSAQGGRVRFPEVVPIIESCSPRGCTWLRGTAADVEETVQLTYLNIPVLLQVSGSIDRVHPYVKFGPQLSIELSATKEISPAPSTGLRRYASRVDNIASYTNDYDFGLHFSGGVEIPVASIDVFVEARFVLGLTDIGTGGDSDVLGPISNRVFGLMLGVGY